MSEKKENKEYTDPLVKINHQSGMTVPEGFFAEFNARMARELPPIDFEKSGVEEAVKRTFWQRIRPYAYMAAMFGGVWCMMNMFDLVRNDADLSVSNHPVVTAAVDNDMFFNDYVVPSIDDQTLMDELYEEGFDATDFNNN